MNRFVQQAWAAVQTATEQVAGSVAMPWRVVRKHLGRMPCVASWLAGPAADPTRYDEKHYLVIPYRLSETGYAHTQSLADKAGYKKRTFVGPGWSRWCPGRRP
jgi:hypothetical protein